MQLHSWYSGEIDLHLPDGKINLIWYIRADLSSYGSFHDRNTLLCFFFLFNAFTSDALSLTESVGCGVPGDANAKVSTHIDVPKCVVC